MLPLPDFKGEEIDCELPPYIENLEVPKPIAVEESPDHFWEIYSYSSNLSGFSLKQYFNAEWKPKIHLGIKNPIVYSWFGKEFYESEEDESKRNEEYVPYVNVGDLI